MGKRPRKNQTEANVTTERKERTGKNETTGQPGHAGHTLPPVPNEGSGIPGVNDNPEPGKLSDQGDQGEHANREERKQRSHRKDREEPSEQADRHDPSDQLENRMREIAREVFNEMLPTLRTIPPKSKIELPRRERTGHRENRRYKKLSVSLDVVLFRELTRRAHGEPISKAVEAILWEAFGRPKLSYQSDPA